ncbi:MAG: hypothetical protein A2927_01435 [Candidatus Komeilibacteria bacterium RIFCSPLOWO2_01_FULL_45_10]|uniref:Transketolase-like pyrimidine-binding domain-containing protein n=1 Tax=Candidatus Komeilibacteria bacterium RIFCSPLOWO2_01_FULL_45_10 TaxID=1798550 RepID=A0A1G2BLD2_9BACT|nr:MAG: hypothetical protein A2927_01435 [Candidatus Komeilibacteria bacterium RIFCSPLOWO2_01_FULL_45_10]
MNITGKISLREAFGQELLAQGKIWPDLVVLDAGTSNSTYSQLFGQMFPNRFFNAGINELGMIGLATGMAMAGRRVVACDMSIFLQHAYAHLVTAARQGDIHLIVAATHTGVTVGADGGSAQDVTDIGRMRLIPNFTIVAPWDGNQTRLALRQMLEQPGLYYLRLNRPALPIFTSLEDPFQIGRAYRLVEGNGLTLIAMGDIVHQAIEAAEKVGESKVEIIGVATVEPLDEQTILESAAKTGKVITLENHSLVGGLSEQIAGLLRASHLAVPLWPMALPREFGTSGEPEELLKLYQLDVDSVVRLCQEVIQTAVL